VISLPSGKNEILNVSFTLGEFDPSADGAYRNVKTFPLQVRPGDLFISVVSERPVDIALSDGGGICIKFRESILCDTVGPVEIKKKETIALIAGIFRGDRTEISIKAWMG
jgi:hypothetical protein